MKDFYSHSSYLKVKDFIFKKGMINSGDKVIASVSGGADSVFMLYCLAGLKEEINFSLSVCHFNHLLRDAANDEKLFVEKLASSFNLPFYYGEGNVLSNAKKKGISIEMSAREMRHNFFDNLLKEDKGNLLALAHNLTDSIETFFLNIERGTGLRGLKGIPAKSDKIVRPLLCLTKDEIREVLDSFGIEYKIDESNFDTRIKRNLIRSVLVSDLKTVFGKRYEKSFFSLFENIENTIYSQAFFIENFLKKNAYIGTDAARIKKDFLKNLPEYVFFEIMLFLFDRISGSTFKISKSLLMELWNFINLPRSSKRSLFSDKSLIAVSTKKFFYIVKKEFFANFNVALKSTGEYSIAPGYKFVVEECSQFVKSRKNEFCILNKFYLDSSLNIGRIDFLNDYIVLKGEKILDLNRFLKKKGLSKFERETIPVLKKDNEILFIPFIAVSEKLTDVANNRNLIKVYMIDCLG